MSTYTDIAAGSPLIVEPINDRYKAIRADLKSTVTERLGYGIRSGCAVEAQASPNLSVHITAGTSYIPDGNRITVVNTDVNVTVTTVSHTDEIKTVNANNKVTTTYAPVVDNLGNLAIISKVTITKTVDNTAVNVTAINPTTGEITVDAAEGTEVYIQYRHGLKRIDVVTIDNNGAISLVAGTPHLTTPIAPTVVSTSLKLANVLVYPKTAACVETSDITTLSDKTGLWISGNDVTIEGDLTVKGQATLLQTSDSLVVRTGILNDLTDTPVNVLDNLYVQGNITLDGTVDGRDIALDGSTLDTHIAKTVDQTSTNTTKDKHISNALTKAYSDHIAATGNTHSTTHNQLNSIGEVDTSSTDATKDKHVSNALAKGWEDHRTSSHLALGETSGTAYRGDRGKTAYDHSQATGNQHSTNHSDLNNIGQVNTGDTDSTKDKHVSNNLAKAWNDHLSAASPHSGEATVSYVDTNLGNHINNTTGAHAASAIANTAAGNIASTTVQAAINELDSEKVNTSEVVTSATANKLLKLDSNAKLPATVTGDADATVTKLETHKTSTDHDSHIATNHYTKTDLQTSGSASIHWGNLTNIPNLADNSWKPAVATLSALPTTSNSINDMRVVVDDGDSKSAIYRCKATTGDIATQWEKLADLDWTNDHGSLVGLGDDDHTQYHNDTRGDARYYTKTQIDTSLSGKSDTSHAHSTYVTKSNGTFATNVDFAQYQATNLVEHKGVSFPENPVVGQRFYRTDLTNAYIYKGTSLGWTLVSGFGAVMRRETFTASTTGTNTIMLTEGHYDVGEETLAVFVNGALVAHTEINSTSFSATANSGDTIIAWYFENVSASANTAIMTYTTNTYTATADGETNIPIGINTYDKDTDVLRIYYSNLMLFETIDYTLNTNNTSIDLVGMSINTGDKVLLEVIKKYRETPTDTFSGSLLTDDTVTTTKLATGAITTTKIADGAITTAKLNSDVTFDQLINASYSLVSNDVTGIFEIWAVG